MISGTNSLPADEGKDSSGTEDTSVQKKQLFLMSTDITVSFKKSDKNNVYLYRENNLLFANGIFYYIEGREEKQYLSREQVLLFAKDVFNQPAENPEPIKSIRFLKQAILNEITSQTAGTRLGRSSSHPPTPSKNSTPKVGAADSLPTQKNQNSPKRNLFPDFVKSEQETEEFKDSKEALPIEKNMPKMTFAEAKERLAGQEVTLKIQEEAIKALQNKNNKLAESIQAKDKELTQLKQEHPSANNSLAVKESELQEARTKIEEFGKLIALHKEQEKTPPETLAENKIQEAKEAFEKKEKELQTRLDELEETLRQEKEAKAALKEKNEEYLNILQGVSEKDGALEATHKIALEKVNNKLILTENQHKELQKEFEEIKSSLNELQEKHNQTIEEKNEELKTAQTSLETFKKEHEASAIVIANTNLNIEIGNKEQQFNQLQLQKTEVNNQLKEAKEKIAELTQDLNQAREKSEQSSEREDLVNPNPGAESEKDPRIQSAEKQIESNEAQNELYLKYVKDSLGVFIEQYRKNNKAQERTKEYGFLEHWTERHRGHGRSMAKKIVPKFEDMINTKITEEDITTKTIDELKNKIKESYVEFLKENEHENWTFDGKILDGNYYYDSLKCYMLAFDSVLDNTNVTPKTINQKINPDDFRRNYNYEKNSHDAIKTAYTNLLSRQPLQVNIGEDNISHTPRSPRGS